MPLPDGFSVVSSLPPVGPWRRALALERAGGEPRAVVLSYAPPSLVDDPARLATLVRDVEAAGRLHHPAAVPVLGTQPAGDALVVVEAFRPGETLQALLDAAGRLPPAIAARVVADACAAIACAHAIDAGNGAPLVHGGLSPARIAVGHDGTALVSGFAMGGGGVPAADVRGLAAILHECLVGEPPGADPASLEIPGIPRPLAEVVSLALRSDDPPSAEALGRAIAAAEPLAAAAEVVAYASAVRPTAREGDEPEREAEDEAQAADAVAADEPVRQDLVVEPAEVRAVAAPADPLPAAVAPDAARVFAAPSRPESRSTLPLVIAVCAAAGFVLGFAAAWASARPGDAPGPGARREAVASAEPTSPAQPSPPASSAEAAAPAPAERVEPAATVALAPPSAAPELAREPAPRSAAKTSSAPARREPPARRAAPTSAKGVLDVRAPDAAEVFLDGRLLGRGSLRRDVPTGAHRIEVRLGASRVSERFEVAVGETWTYDVTPTP